MRGSVSWPCRVLGTIRVMVKRNVLISGQGSLVAVYSYKLRFMI